MKRESSSSSRCCCCLPPHGMWCALCLPGHPLEVVVVVVVVAVVDGMRRDRHGRRQSDSKSSGTIILILRAPISLQRRFALSFAVPLKVAAALSSLDLLVLYDSLNSFMFVFMTFYHRYFFLQVQSLCCFLLF